MKKIILLFLLLIIKGLNLSAQTFKLTDKVFKEGDVFVAKGIYFDFARWTFRPESFTKLDSIAEFLKRNNHLFVEIGSHTDSRMGDACCMTYTGKRAKAIAEYLVAKGADSAHIVHKGFEYKMPRVIYTNSSFFKKGDILTDEYISKLKTEEEKEEAHQMNRRTELKILKIE